MKKILLSASALLIGLTASAQLAATGDGFLVDNLNASSNCIINVGLPNNGGIMNGDGASLASSELTDKGLELTSADVIAAGVAPTWFALHVIAGPDTAQICSNLSDENMGIDMTSQNTMQVVAKGTNVGDTLELFLGGSGRWSPATSTFNTGSGDGVAAYYVFTKAGEFETFTIDFQTTNPAVWTAWSLRSQVQSVGFRSAAPNAVFTIETVAIGSSQLPVGVATATAASVSVYPNPATDVVNVVVGSDNASVQLVSLTGAVVASGNGSGTVALSTANVSAGLYVVSVSSATGTTIAKVVVK
jgi:hypothetical protein